MRVRKSAINLIWLEQVHTTRPCFKNLLSIMYFLPPGWGGKKKKVRMVSKYTSGFIRGELTTQKVTVTWCRSLKYAHKLGGCGSPSLLLCSRRSHLPPPPGGKPERRGSRRRSEGKGLAPSSLRGGYVAILDPRDKKIHAREKWWAVLPVTRPLSDSSI